jgi:hypothetical protein
MCTCRLCRPAGKDMFIKGDDNTVINNEAVRPLHLRCVSLAAVGQLLEE